ncbi:MAG: IS66 family insertion sequence element accessory protein TnpA [Monoglobales bacterium]
MDKIVQIKNNVKLHEWSMMVKACRSSGLTVSQWCNENDIKLKTYYYRLRKVREYLCEETEVHPILPISVPIEEMITVV